MRTALAHVTAPHWRLFPKYATLIIAVVAGVLLVSGAISIYFSYRETRTQLVALQFEKAQGAATRIEQYMLDIEHQLSWTALPRVESGGDPLEQRRIEYLKLLRQTPAITEVVWMDPAGLEQLRVSRLGMDSIATGADMSRDPRFTEAAAGKTYYGPVYFLKGTEPYMTIARAAGSGGGVTAAEVNLKFVWDVVSRIKIGRAGLAYVVDAGGTLIAHPDISLVLKKSDLSPLPQVAARDAPEGQAQPVARDLSGAEVFAAHARIPALGWTVFVESPRAEAYAPLYATILRTGLLLLAGLLVATALSFFLARALVRPIQALQEGAARLGAGELEHRIDVHTGDELETLAAQFNQMGADLRASYAGLERKVDERTSELTVSLAYQTATSEILRVISESPTDAQPVFDAVLRSCERLFGAVHMGISMAGEDGLVHLAAQHGSANREAFASTFPVPLTAESGSGQAILQRRVVQYPDVAGPDVPLFVRRSSEAVGTRAVVLAPLLWEGRAIGVIFIGRPEPGPFSEKDVALLKTFADQSVIAIQNARLFNDTREALEQQRASAEVLSVIGRSVADAQPVFDSILLSCERLFDNSHVVIDQLGSDNAWHLAAYAGPHPEELAAMYPAPAEAATRRQSELMVRKVTHFPDVATATNMSETLRRGCELVGCKSLAIVPMLSEEGRLGTILVGRHTREPFSAKETAMLLTFADQAVIAIRNARLIQEIRSTSRELAQANQHKSEFLANMSHELRTPLNAIIGFSEVLSEKMFGDVNDKQLEYLNDINTSGHHLLSLINDILDLSKIEAGRMELDLSSFDLGMLLDNSTTLVRERALRQGLTLTLDVDEGLGEWVADQRKLKQVLVNLLSNAVKFTPAGGSVTLRARRLDHAVEIAVVDTGVGIAADQQALVFEEFRQATGEYLRKAEGTGLGLALAKRFVELHGGTMRLESAPGQGSTFAFDLPERELEAV
ncbi:ATP-binding protein [Variovorax sp. dw_954]|uniref:ATP-binding protein n=1 Tax=Variovorax sp. dw_954 TaxID=2720078 RepID=UPI001BD36AF2|nr:ATP-binding protein [Variovorax sp. dw_954]